MDYQSFQPGGQSQNGISTELPPVQPMPTKHFTPKFIGVILILVALGAGASYGIWWWGNQNSQVAVLPATPDPTANWKTYTNTEYGFEVKYPLDWNYRERSDGTAVGFDSRNTAQLDPDVTTYKISIFTAPNTKRIGVENWLKTYYQGVTITDQQQLTIYGWPAVQTAQAPTIGYPVTETHILYNSADYVTYVIRLSNTNDSGDIRIYNQILSTFKFVDKAACAQIRNASFKSAEKYEAMGPNGPIMEYWGISFDKTGIAGAIVGGSVAWYPPGAVENGTYTCTGSTITLKFPNGQYTASYDSATKSLIFEGKKYLVF